MAYGAYDYVPIERVVWGKPAHIVVTEELARLSASRVFIVASKSLARNADAFDDLRQAVGSREVGLFDGCREHTPLDTVIACADAVRQADPDVILTVGGGTPIDTVKLVQICLSHDIHTADALLALAGQPTVRRSPIRQIIVPTTLSGGEYSCIAGGTDVARQSKDLYFGPDLCARTAILDPAITVHTPHWLWQSTAIRALDHAIEGYCAPNTNALVQANALHAMRLFSRSLRQSRLDPSDLDARHESQMAVWLAASGLGRVSMGASHGIGYLLGTMFGIPHGYTSCVMLSAVLQWNQPVNGIRDGEIAAALGAGGVTASAAVSALLHDLDMPRRLSDVDIGEDKFEAIAERAFRHPVVRSNPRPIESVEEVKEILSIAL